MNIACLSDSAAGWLSLLDVAFDVPESLQSLEPRHVDLVIVPGENERDTERAAGFGALPGGERRVETAAIAAWPTEKLFVWAPYTLKSAMDAALRLARAVGRLPKMMHVLGEREKALKALSHGRKEASGRAPAAICLICRDTCHVMGLWAPDLIERAGGEPLLLQAGDPSIPLRAGDLAQRPPDIIFAGLRGREAAGEDRLRAALSGAPFESEVYLVSPDMLLTSGPALHETVLQFSVALRGKEWTPGTGMNVLRRHGSAGGNKSDTENAR
jgi:hypothetical protein